MDPHDLQVPPLFGIADKAAWARRPRLDPNGIEVALPEGFEEELEGMFSYDGHHDDGRQALLDAGLSEIPCPF